MLPIIPAMIAITLALTYILNPSNFMIEDRLGEQIGENLLLEHIRSVRIAQDNGLTNETIDNALTAPLRSMGDWRIQVISNGGKTVVVTYMPGEPSRIDPEVVRAFGEIGPKKLRRLPESYSGTYTYSPSSNGGAIGGGDFSSMSLPLPENTPALITVINPYYVPPGGGPSASNNQG